MGGAAGNMEECESMCCVWWEGYIHVGVARAEEPAARMVDCFSAAVHPVPVQGLVRQLQ